MVVLCSSVAPFQKAVIVDLIKSHTYDITLAIGGGYLVPLASTTNSILMCIVFFGCYSLNDLSFRFFVQCKLCMFIWLTVI